MQICQVIKMTRNKNGNLRHKTAANMPLTSLRLIMEIKLKIMPFNSIKKRTSIKQEVCKSGGSFGGTRCLMVCVCTWGNYGLIDPT